MGKTFFFLNQLPLPYKFHDSSIKGIYVPIHLFYLVLSFDTGEQVVSQHATSSQRQCKQLSTCSHEA